MAQNITLLGASYSDVPSVLLPKTGGGTASFTDVTDTTAAAADVASGKYFYTAAGVLTQGTASGGGGGASNIVTGTFKGTTTNTAMDITLNYSGSGYPIAVVIYPLEGAYNNDSGTFYTLVQRYAVNTYIAVKACANLSATYPSESSVANTDNASMMITYKSSSSNSTSMARSGNNSVNIYRDADASSTTSGTNVVRLKSKTKMSVFIAGTSYGFAANIDYKYWVMYSS